MKRVPLSGFAKPARSPREELGRALALTQAPRVAQQMLEQLEKRRGELLRSCERQEKLWPTPVGRCIGQGGAFEGCQDAWKKLPRPLIACYQPRARQQSFARFQRCFRTGQMLAKEPRLLELLEGLDAIKRAATVSFGTLRMGPAGVAVRKFPSSTSWTPREPCCRGPRKWCRLDRSAWSRSPTWSKLGYRPKGSHYFQWRFSSSGIGRDASFTLEARADLDCTGRPTSYTVRGRVDQRLSVRIEDPLLGDSHTYAVDLFHR